jgi:hypothetical protein
VFDVDRTIVTAAVRTIEEEVNLRLTEMLCFQKLLHLIANERSGDRCSAVAGCYEWPV